MKSGIRLSAAMTTLFVVATASIASQPAYSEEEYPPGQWPVDEWPDGTWWNLVEGPGDHRIPMETVTVGSADTAQMPDGTWRTWAVSNARPAKLVEIDPRTGTALRDIEIGQKAIGSWGTKIAEDGTVWTASHTSGVLFYLPPGGSELQATERPTPTTSFIWQVDTDDQGRVYGGTFEGWGDPKPPGRLFRFDPATQEMKVYDAFADNAIYVRATAVVGDYAYAGTGSEDGRLYRVHSESGDTEEIPLPPEVAGTCNFVYELSNVGPLLFTHLKACGDVEAIGYVYDTRTGTWSDPLPGFNNANVEASEDGRVWMTLDGELASYDPDTAEIARYGVMTAGSKATQVITDQNGQEVVVTMSYLGNMDRYTISTGEFTSGAVDGMPGDTGLPAFASEVGPDGRIYTSVAFGGGLAMYDPVTETWESHGEWKRESESMVAHDGLMYIGTYPQARLWVYDPEKEFGPENPRLLTSLADHGQDRPWALTAVGDSIAIGTVADYGQTQGALSFYDTTTGDVEVHKDLAIDQGYAAATSSGPVVFAGTTSKGGPGSAPASEPGHVIAYDTETETKLWDAVPVPDETGITSLVTTDDGRLFGIGFATAFELDPESGAVIATKKLNDRTPPEQGYWRSADLNYDPCDAHLYTSLANRLLQIDPDTLESRELNSGNGPGRGVRMMITDDGTKYWFNQRILVTGRTYPLDTCPGDKQSPTISATVDDRTRTLTIDADDNAAGVESVEYRVGEGPWQSYDDPIEVPQPTTVHARATDRNGNSTGEWAIKIPPPARQAVNLGFNISLHCASDEPETRLTVRNREDSAAKVSFASSDVSSEAVTLPPGKTTTRSFSGDGDPIDVTAVIPGRDGGISSYTIPHGERSCA